MRISVGGHALVAAAIVALAIVGTPAAPRAQEPPAVTELPPVVVTTSPPTQQKYPAPKVKMKPSGAATAQAAATPVAVPAGAATTPGTPIPAIAVVGDIVGERQGLYDLDGSGAVVTGAELYTSHVFNTNEALRKVPGVYVRDEEGFGMRPNIGIRGLNPTRSSKTLLLEDGLFLTYAPYGENASYFHPLMDRYDHVEVIKGADMLRYGPQTISGIVNYVTPNPPREPSGFAAGTMGNRDYLSGQLFYGGWVGNFGGLVDFVHKRGNGARDNTEHEITDFGVKGIAQVTPESAFIAKASYFTEDSQVTYSGITDAEMRNFGIRYNPFDNDTFNTERYGTSLTHNWDFTEAINIRSSLYYNSFSRDWWRQSSRTTDNQCNASYPTFTQDRLNGIAVNPDQCNSIQGRLRDYYSYGLDERVSFDHKISQDVKNRLKVGFRIHSEDQARLQVNRRIVTGGDTLAEDNERDAFALSYFAENRIEMGPFSVTPGVRYEDIHYERRNLLFGSVGCAVAPCEGESNISEVIPGISVGFDPMRKLNFFAGVHEGFAPPRVEDSIANSGGSIEVDAEESINFEAGFRSEVIAGLKFDSTLFHNDFDNLVAVGSVAGADQPLAQGQALFEGLEVYARADSRELLGTPWNIYGQVAWTYLWTAEQLSPFQCVDPIAAGCVGGLAQGDTTGNRQPYAPEHLVTAKIGYAVKNFDVNVEMVYVGAQYADFLNLESGADHPNGPASDAARSGQFGKIDAYTLFNVATTYTIESTETDLYFTVKNLFDDEYIVDRTRGILPGAPRLVQVGVKQSF